MHPHSDLDWILAGPWMRQKTQGEDREILPPRRGSQAILGKGGIRRHTNRPRGNDLKTTLDHLTATFFTVCPRMDRTNASEGTSQLDMDSNARSHDYRLFKSMLDALTYLAQSRLLGIISNKTRLGGSLPGAIRRIRAHPTAPPQRIHAAA